MVYPLSCFQQRDIGHIWELGGGAFLSKLTEVPLKAETIRYERYLAAFPPKVVHHIFSSWQQNREVKISCSSHE